MKRLFFSFALLFIVAKAHAVSFTVSDIRLDGLQRVSASPVFAALSIRVGDTIDDEDIRQNIQSLFETGFFSNVQMARDGNVLIVVLQERPAIKTITIKGNKAIKTEQLNDVLKDNKIAEGEILQRQLLQGIARELERTYIAQARYGAKVDAVVEDLPNNMVNIKINIDEGKASKIRHLNFVGNKKFSTKELSDLFELTTAKLTTIFSSNDQYSKEKLKGDIEKLKSFYLNKGYLDFSVVSSQISVSPDKRSVYITLNLHEGDIYQVKSVDVSGDPIIPVSTVRRLILVREGETYSQELMDDTTEYMKTLLGNAGYTNAKVEGITNKDEKNKTVDVTLFVDPGKRVYVRHIEFSGNTKTADEVLRREMRQMESSSAANSRIDQGKVRLERLGYFKDVKSDTKPVPGKDDQLDILYTVEEQPSGTISASVGYAAYSGLNLGINIQQNNWMGSGKQVAFGINRNLYQTQYQFSYTDPYFTPDGVSRGFSAYYRTRDTKRLQTVRYSADTYGTDVNFGYPISEISRINLSVGLEHQTITTGAYVPQEIRQTPFIRDYLDANYYKKAPFLANTSTAVYVNESDLKNLSGGTALDSLPIYAVTDDMLVDPDPGFIDKYGTDFTNATMSVGWTRITLNRGIMATRGSSQSLRIQSTAPGSDMEYYKLYYDGQMFKPLSKKFTLRFRTSLGYGDGYGKMKELPFFENFYAGGFGSVRGFEQSTLGPKGSFSKTYLTTSLGAEDLNRDGLTTAGESFGNAYVLCNDPGPTTDSGDICTPGKLRTGTQVYADQRGNAIGGNILVEFGTDLILPIPFVEDSRSMQLVAFVDAGNVFSSYCRDAQLNCSNVDLGKLSSSVGLGFTWISSMGPMTFSFAKALHESRFDKANRKVFDFTFGAGF